MRDVGHAAAVMDGVRFIVSAAGDAAVHAAPFSAAGSIDGGGERQSIRVASYATTQASLSIPGAPSVPVNIAVVPPLRFRMRASLPFTGPEVDIGSNDELFWFWIRRSQPPALYYCRHDQFAASAARQIMPVEPQWIIEAMGLPRFSPADQPQGPFPVGEGRVQIRTVRHSAVGELTKVTVLDERRGLVLEQELYDRPAAAIATALTSGHAPRSGHRRHHADGNRDSISERNLSLKITAKQFQVNTMGAANTALWTKPQYAGFPDVDLASINAAAPPGAAVIPLGPPPAALPPNNYPPPTNYPPPAATYLPPSVIDGKG